MRITALALAVAMALGVAAAPAQAQSASDLVSSLAKELGSSTQQAAGAAGSLFRHARSRMKRDDWTKVANAVGDMDSLLQAARSAPVTTGAAEWQTDAGIREMTGAFSTLGLKHNQVQKAVSFLTSYVTKSGGSDVGKLLARALK